MEGGREWREEGEDGQAWPMRMSTAAFAVQLFASVDRDQLCGAR